jgi:uncharacterized RmlC-like cupin family protein
MTSTPARSADPRAVGSPTSTTVEAANLLDALRSVTQTPHGPLIVEVVQATEMSVGALYVRPGDVAAAHVHAQSDIFIAVLSGFARTIYGHSMESTQDHRPGDIAMIPAGTPHAAVNLDPRRPVIGVEVRACVPFGADLELRPALQPVMDRWRRRVAAGELRGDLRTLRRAFHGSTTGGMQRWERWLRRTVGGRA